MMADDPFVKQGSESVSGITDSAATELEDYSNDSDQLFDQLNQLSDEELIQKNGNIIITCMQSPYYKDNQMFFDYEQGKNDPNLWGGYISERDYNVYMTINRIMNDRHKDDKYTEEEHNEQTVGNNPIGNAVGDHDTVKGAEGGYTGRGL